METMQKEITDKIEKITKEMKYHIAADYDYSNTGTFYICDKMLLVYFSVKFNFQAGYVTFKILDADNKMLHDLHVNYNEIPNFLGAYSEILDEHRNG